MKVLFAITDKRSPAALLAACTRLEDRAWRAFFRAEDALDNVTDNFVDDGRFARLDRKANRALRVASASTERADLAQDAFWAAYGGQPDPVDL